MLSKTFSVSSSTQGRARPAVARRVMTGLGELIGALALGLPVLLLPLSTAVPIQVWLPLLLADVAALALATRWLRPGQAALAVGLAWFVIAILAVLASQVLAATPPMPIEAWATTPPSRRRLSARQTAEMSSSKRLEIL